MRTLTKSDVTIDVLHSREDASIDKYAGEPACIRYVRDQIAAGNEWAWCQVEVRATWIAPSGRAYSASDYLGCCSYEDEAAFKNDGYYVEMVDQAIDALNAHIASLAGDLLVAS